MAKYSDNIKKFRSNEKLMEELLRYQTSFRNFVAVIANHSLGVNVIEDRWRPQFLYKCEGGVTVNGRDIVLGSDSAYDDYGKAGNESAEAKTVVEALDYVLGYINSAGDVQKGLMDAAADFFKDWSDADGEPVLIKIQGSKVDSVFGGDPWRNFFGNTHTKRISKANEEAAAAGKKERYF